MNECQIANSVVALLNEYQVTDSLVALLSECQITDSLVALLNECQITDSLVALLNECQVKDSLVALLFCSHSAGILSTGQRGSYIGGCCHESTIGIGCPFLSWLRSVDQSWLPLKFSNQL